MANELQRLPDHQALAPAQSDFREPEQAADVRLLLRPLFVRRRLIAVIFCSLVLLVGLYSFLAPPMYECSASLLVQESDLGLSQTMGQLGTMLGGGKLTSGPSVTTETAILNSKQLIEQAVQRAGLDPQRRRDWRLEARELPRTAIIKVVARAHSVAKATALCRSLVEVYLECTRRLNSQAAGTAARIVYDQMNQTQRKLIEAEDRLRRFRQRTGTMALDVETKERISRLADITQQLQQAGAEQNASAAQLGRVQVLLRQETPRITSVTNYADNPVVEQLRQQLTELETSRAAALQEYVPTSSMVKSLDARIADVQRRLSLLARQQMQTVIKERQEAVNPVHQALLQTAATLDASRYASQARISALSQAASTDQEQLATLPDKEFELAQLMRETQTYAGTYALLSSKYQELKINEEAELANARLLEQPKAKPGRVAPRRMINLFLAAMLGLLLGVGAALLVDQLDPNLRFSDQIASQLGVDILGHVRALPAPEQLLLPDLAPGSELAEDYRTLRSHIALAPTIAPLQALLVTSATSAEGKSVTALNLATVFARQGRRVLLVDSDLRRPTLHEKLGLPCGQGLAEVLVGKAAPEGVIRETAVPHLFLLSAGQARAEAVDLLEQGRVRALLAALRSHYELIVLDSPPALGLADAQVLASAADGVLLVVEAGAATRQDLSRVRQLMAFVRANLIGAVVNRVDLAGEGRYDSYVQYRYYPSGGDTQALPPLPAGPNGG